MLVCDSGKCNPSFVVYIEYLPACNQDPLKGDAQYCLDYTQKTQSF